jgi:hypothetical protein
LVVWPPAGGLVVVVVPAGGLVVFGFDGWLARLPFEMKIVTFEPEGAPSRWRGLV